MKLSEQTRSDIDKAFKALADITIIADALVEICDFENCTYWHDVAYKLAKNYVSKEDD